MSGAVDEAQTGAFLIALRTKGETVDEMVGLARTMRELALPVKAAGDDPLETDGRGRGGRPPGHRRPGRGGPALEGLDDRRARGGRGRRTGRQARKPFRHEPL